MKWTDREEAVLLDCYRDPSVPDNEVDEEAGKRLGRCPGSVGRKRRRMGLQMETRSSTRTEPEFAAEPEVAGEALPYYYDVASEVYVFPVDGRVYTLPGSTWDSVCADYALGAGNLTQSEIATKYGLPRSAVTAILRSAARTKADLPVSRERLAEATVDELVDDVLAAKARSVEAKSQAKAIRSMERELRALKTDRLREDAFVERAVEVAKGLAGSLPPVRKFTHSKLPVGDDWIAHVPTSDEHIGSLVWAKEAFGEDYDTDIGCERLKAHARTAASWIASQPGRCVKVRRTFVGDLLDSLLGETEHGTRLDMDTRGPKVLVMLIEALKYGVEVLREVCDVVEIDGSKGNHDGRIEFFFTMLTLKEAFSECEDVIVNVSPRRFSVFREGETLHVLDHGYGMGAPGTYRAQAQADVIAREFGRDVYDGARRIITYSGHQHKRAEAEHDHHEAIKLPALCEPDDYLTGNRQATRSGAILFRLDSRGRIETTRRLYVDDLNGKD